MIRRHSEPLRGLGHADLAIRGLRSIPSSPLFEGRFGRMFRELKPFEPSDGSIKALADTMFEPDGANNSFDSKIPSGYTYLGQFIDHDITFDPVSSLQRQNDPDALVDFRSPNLDLDNLYGRGPKDEPYLYAGHPADPDLGGLVFLLGNNVGNGLDLPRNPDGPDNRALIGDPRNDENFIVSQLHTVFLRFHNKAAEEVKATTAFRGDDLFKETQRLVRWHYQWVIVHDFLSERIVGEDVVNDILPGKALRAGDKSHKRTEPELRFFKFKKQVFMPVEFSVAAYRFGHSMIRPSYKINDPVPERPIFTPDLAPNSLANLNGFRPLPPNWGFDFRRFFEVDPSDNAHPVQFARLIDTKLAHPLLALPAPIATNPSSLAERNLLRGKALGLPSGQEVAHAMGIDPIPDSELGIVGISQEFTDHAPLWFYVLKEAELLAKGQKLGPVGGRIVAEVLIGLLAADPFSYINVRPNWTPDFADKGTFGMPELIRFTLGPKGGGS